MNLTSIAGVTAEMGRIYRATINQRIKSAESARLIYMLREIRCCIEAEPPKPADQTTAVNIVAVPVDCYVREAAASSDRSRYRIEHMVNDPTPALEHTPQLEHLEPEAPAASAQGIETYLPEEARVAS